jgi:competence protein CoiA
MQFAIVEGQSSEPMPGLKGTCKNCGSPMIAKCGQHKLWHWAHQSRVHCDPWWEAETDWHRDWKNRFPLDWHECICFDGDNNEKHIADVKTEHGLVLEFQHSPIAPAEMKSREDFYGNMVWIVDGCRGELDAAHFNMGLGGRVSEAPVAYSFQWYGRGKLFENWILATKPVLIDFGGANLWRLVMFDRSSKKGAVGPGSKEYFVQDFMENKPLARIIR